MQPRRSQQWRIREHRGSASGGLGGGPSNKENRPGSFSDTSGSTFGGKLSGVAGETRSGTAQHAGNRSASGNITVAPLAGPEVVHPDKLVGIVAVLLLDSLD